MRNTMSKIAILTDSSCDIPQELAEKYGIDIMGFHILLDDEDIVEREKYTPEEFYDKMRAAKGIPSTAAITPIQFCEKYCQYVDEGYTDVIHVPINRSGSSTYNNAVMAQGMLREERPEHHLNIHLLDPHTYSMVFGWYLCEMARKLQNGAELRHVISEFETQMRFQCHQILIHTLCKLFRQITELNELISCTNRYLGMSTNTGNHTRRSDMGE